MLTRSVRRPSLARQAALALLVIAGTLAAGWYLSGWLAPRGDPNAQIWSP